jgi:enoyl-CoA hydratase/carnithine racemase
MSPVSSSAAFTVSREGHIVTVTLANPAKRNALSLDVMQALIATFRELAGTDARGIVLAAEGPAFSAGHDFADLAGADFTAVQRLFDVCTDLMDTIQQIPQIVVARVHAVAAAAGCQLAASCDLVVAAESAGFALSGVKRGLFCHTPLVAVSRNVGRKRALEMALTGEVIDARTAADWGLVNRVVPDEQLDDAVADLIGRATADSAWTKSMGKRAFYAQVDLDQPKAYAYAVEVMASGVTAPPGQEGIAAFLEKRPPKFD